jgi:hypothetical protein
MAASTLDIAESPVHVGSIAARQRFQRWLDTYGLEHDRPHAEALTVDAGRVVRLDDLCPRLISTTDIDQAKVWIGIEDKVFAKHPQATPHYVAGHGPAHAPNDFDRLAKAYLYGDSRGLRHVRELFDRSSIVFSYRVWFVKRIEIMPRGVLELGGDGAILVADAITIHGGGQLRSNGSRNQIKIVCSSFTRVEG